MEKYRVMVRGEDGMEFCYQNNVPENRLDHVCAEAKRAYPCGSVFYEPETVPFYF